MDTCPKCQQVLADTNALVCPHCGIVFAKYFKYHPEASQNESAQVSETAEPVRVVFYDDAQTTLTQSLEDVYAGSVIHWFGRGVVWLGLMVWSWLLIDLPLANNSAGESFLHLVNLPFHEAGHIIFRPFGQFITSLGGTLGQLLMPAICAGTLLLKTRDPFGAVVALWWFGENFLDIAPYMNDAQAGELPLVGGNFGHSAPYGFHDWEYLLTESGLMRYDHLLAGLTFFIGVLIMLAALVAGGFLLWRQRNHLRDVLQSR